DLSLTAPNQRVDPQSFEQWRARFVARGQIAQYVQGAGAQGFKAIYGRSYSPTDPVARAIIDVEAQSITGTDKGVILNPDLTISPSILNRSLNGRPGSTLAARSPSTCKRQKVPSG